MGNKSYYALLSVMFVSLVSMFYLFYSSGDDKHQAKIDKVVIEESIDTVDTIEDNIQRDKRGGIVTPAAKKFVLKKQRKQREVHQTATMKLYEDVDSDAFMARIEDQIQESDYEGQSYDETSLEIDDEMETFKEKEEKILAIHKDMILAFNASQDTNPDDSYEMDNDAIDSYEDDIASYDANYDYQ